MHKIYWGLLLCLCFNTVSLAQAQTYEPAKNWVAVQGSTQNGALELQAGSILDFSHIADSPAISSDGQRIIINSQGKFATVDNPTKPLRFLIGSWSIGVAEGKLPPAAEITRYVNQFKLHGYNMVRIGQLELNLMMGQDNDFEFNPTQFDRFHFLIAELKKNGMYVFIEGLTNGDGGLGDRKLRQAGELRYYGYSNLATRAYIDPVAQKHWKDLMSKMYGTVNPYTGVALLKDPVLMGVILSNEGGINFRMEQEFNRDTQTKNILKPYFNQWLKVKYNNNNQALKNAWDKFYKQNEKLQANESLNNSSVNFADINMERSPRMYDTQAFIWQTEVAAIKWMTDYLRRIGYQGPITSYNNQHSRSADATRSQLEWVDMHAYFAHPQGFAEPGSIVAQGSMLAQNAYYIAWLANARHVGKPYTISEHGQVFWNPYRREASLALPAYAALQDWDGISQHAQPVIFNFDTKTGRRREAIYPFSVGLDPISKVTETLSALLYLREDVQKAQHMVVATFDESDAFYDGFRSYPKADVSSISLLTGLAIDWVGKSANVKGTGSNSSLAGTYSAKVKLQGKPGKLTLMQSATVSIEYTTSLNKNYNEYYDFWQPDFVAEAVRSRMQNLKDANLITVDNLTNSKNGIFESETKELVLDSKNKKMTVITDKTEGIVFDKPLAVTLNNLSIISAEGAALVAISALDKTDTKLADSKRMLLVLSTDAQNSGMKFQDAAHTTLDTLGSQPVRVKPNKIKLALKNTNSSQLKLWSTDLRGIRKDLIPTIKTKTGSKITGIEFELDIRKLSHGATTYFELNII